MRPISLSTKLAVPLAAGLLVLATTATAGAAGTSSPTPTGWSLGGHDLSNTRSNPDQTGLNVGNASRLTTKWTFTTHGDVSATPTVQDGFVYFPDWGGYLYKVDAKTGQQVWAKKLSDYGYNTSADLVSRTAPAVSGNMLYLGDQGGGGANPQAGRVLAVNKNTGKLVWSTAINPNPFTIITQSPVVYKGVVYVGAASAEETAAAFIPGYVCCTFRGSFSALDAATGQVLWTTYMAPAPQPGEDGQYSGDSVWGSTPAIDPKTNTVYISTGNNYSVPATVKTCQDNGGTPAQCLDPTDHVDSILALDMSTGLIKWATGVQGFDDWIVSCIPGIAPNPCPTSTPGPDYDFGSGPNLFTAGSGKNARQLVGAGAKSGIYWAMDAKTGQIVWSNEAGPGSTLGGIEWGTATDGKRVYIAEANVGFKPYPNDPTLPPTGSFAALDAATGQTIWQIPDPSFYFDIGAVSVSNGVMFAGSMSGHMYAINAATGQVLNDFVGQGSSNAGPAIDNNGVVYWGNGYSRFGLGSGSTTFYALSVDGK